MSNVLRLYCIIGALFCLSCLFTFITSQESSIDCYIDKFDRDILCT